MEPALPSPFPGMDPYLEDPEIWEHFHADLATEIRAQLTPQLLPRYFVVLMPRVTYNEIVVEETRVAKPDVGVHKVSEGPFAGSGGVAIAPAPVTALGAIEAPVKEQAFEIRETGTRKLVTAIEILSPVKKRSGSEALETYRSKRRDLMRSDVRLMEIDLLRSGGRPPLVTPNPDTPHFVFLSRSEKRPRVHVWPLRIQEALPVLPVSLSKPDSDVRLDLGSAVRAVYKKAGYQVRIDYAKPPPKPEFPVEDQSWVEDRLRGKST